MKTTFFRVCAVPTAVLMMMAASPAADDLNAIYQQGRAAFYKGDFVTAKEHLSKVAAAAPNHAETQNLLRYIQANAKNAAQSPERSYAAVILPKVEMTDVTLPDALDGLRLLTQNASQGKVTPNIIVKGTQVKETKFSLTLANVPLTEALQYIAQLSGGKLTYDKHAAVISDPAQAEVPNAAAPSPAKAK